MNIVLQNRLCLFGEIIGMEMQLNQAGEMVSEVWEALPNRFPAIAIDTFVVMPNHLHGIIIINQHPVPVGAGLVPAQNVGASSPVGAGLVPAQDVGASSPVGACLVPAQNVPAQNVDASSPVGACLVPAQNVPAQNVPAQSADTPPALGDVIGAYKSLTTVEYTRGVKTMKWTPFHRRLWQRNYYEHIIRNDDSLNHIRQYIINNPGQWAFDRENPFANEAEIQKGSPF